MTYLYGHQSHEILELQQALVEHGFDVGPEGPDGGFGPHTLQAVKDAQAAFKLAPVDGVVRDDLLLALGITTQPPKVGLNPVLTTIINIALSTMKGKGPMLTTMDKAWVAGVVSFVCNYVVNHFFHITIDDGTQGVIVNLVVTFIIPLLAVWLVPNKPKAA